jgi:hypothetical protein
VLEGSASGGGLRRVFGRPRPVDSRRIEAGGNGAGRLNGDGPIGLRSGRLRIMPVRVIRRSYQDHRGECARQKHSTSGLYALENGITQSLAFLTIESHTSSVVVAVPDSRITHHRMMIPAGTEREQRIGRRSGRPARPSAAGVDFSPSSTKVPMSNMGQKSPARCN